MRARRSAAAAVVGLVLLAVPAQSAGRVTLDGQRRTTHRYQGQLDESTATSSDTNPVDAVLAPQPSDCTKRSCDVSTVVLTVPRGRQSGRFDYVVNFSGTVLGERSYTTVAAAGLYDAAGKEVLASAFCCNRFGSVRLSHARLPAGTYTVIVYNHGAPTRFDATLTWHVNPPHRIR